jgi:hypothetical protein
MTESLTFTAEHDLGGGISQSLSLYAEHDSRDSGVWTKPKPDIHHGKFVDRAILPKRVHCPY